MEQFYQLQMRLEKETPILGINLGKLGFLTESSTSNAIELLDEILLHNYRVESRTMIEVNLNRKNILD